MGRVVAVLWLLLASLLIGLSVGLAARANADVDPAAIDYAQRNAGAVCAVLDVYPSPAGVIGIAQAIVDDGLSFNQAGQVVALSVLTECPQHQPVIDRFIARYTQGQHI